MSLISGQRPKGALGTSATDKNNVYSYYCSKDSRKIPAEITSFAILFFISLNICQKYLHTFYSAHRGKKNNIQPFILFKALSILYLCQSARRALIAGINILNHLGYNHTPGNRPNNLYFHTFANTSALGFLLINTMTHIR